jgi:hypothetical protein
MELIPHIMKFLLSDSRIKVTNEKGKERKKDGLG